MFDDASCHLVIPQVNACLYLAPLQRYGASKIMGSQPWPFGIMWRHQSHDNSTPGGRLPISGLQWPCVYLAPLQRYGRLKFFPEDSSRNRGRSSVGRSSILHWFQIILFATLER